MKKDMYKTSLDPMNMISAKTGRMPHEITGWKTVPFPTLNEGHRERKSDP